MKRHTLRSKAASLLEAVVLAGAVVLAILAASGQAGAAVPRCPGNSECIRHIQQPLEQQRSEHYEAALQRSTSAASLRRHTEMSAQDYSTFSGIGVIACSTEGQMRASTAFLVGAFDVGVTVAHTFQLDGAQIQPRDCIYYSTDSRGQVRERIPLASVKTQWDAEADASGVPSKDLAVVRLSQPSRYAQRTMPLGKFAADSTPAFMIGFRPDMSAGAIKRKSRGTAYERSERSAGGQATSGLAGFIHDMDVRGVAAGSPVIDERTGVVIGIHARLPGSRNAMITMTPWLEATLRQELQVQAQLAPAPQDDAQDSSAPVDDAG